MKLKIAFQMDHISKIAVEGDSTFALGLEAQKRGYSLFHYTPERLFMLQGKVFAYTEKMELNDKKGSHFTLGEQERTDLSEMNVILLRQDPPFDLNYITTTHLLERLAKKSFVVNNPVSVRNCPEKICVTLFPDLMPETLITRDEREIASFRREFGDIIVKPLYENGGAGIFYIGQSDLNLGSLLQTFKKMSPEPFIVQRYLKNIRKGDKRIILIDGQPAGAFNRIPASDDTRANLRAGGHPEKTNLTEREYEICSRISPFLRERGFLLVGIDIIDGYLTEINVTSPTGIREVKRFGGEDIASLFWNRVEEKYSLRSF